MGTFYQTCIYICFTLILFNLAIGVVNATGAFPDVETGQDIKTTENALSDLTGLDDPNMNSIWMAVTALTGIGAIALAWVTHSITPVGIWLFGEVFWTSWIRTNSILSFGNYLDTSMIVMISVIIILVFIAAIVGMLTGSG